MMKTNGDFPFTEEASNRIVLICGEISAMWRETCAVPCVGLGRDSEF